MPDETDGFRPVPNPRPDDLGPGIGRSVIHHENVQRLVSGLQNGAEALFNESGAIV
jgi:hypothetical protein